MKYLHKLTEAQVNSIFPFDHNLFTLLYFKEMSDGNFWIHYEGPRPLTVAKGNEIVELIEETKEI